MIKVFLDFDGTLINNKNRLYELFVALAGDSSLSFSKYWELRDKELRQGDILDIIGNYSIVQKEKFANNWLKKIESEEYLQYDYPNEYADELLERLRDHAKLYLWTNRQKKSGVIKQLERYNWLSKFDDILITGHKKTKGELLVDNIQIQDTVFLISDTIDDCCCYCASNVKSILVCSIDKSLGDIIQVRNLKDAYTLLMEMIDGKDIIF